ncbi:MAG: 16S rRNA processing protein RimM [Chloroflexaceae bacterium]|nr:16S rRNA processing protein RimM [Chloroflexaceae bacterium]
MTIAPDDLLLVGRIVAPFGVSGQLKMRAFTDRPDHFVRRVRTVYIGKQSTAYTISHSFEHKPGLLILTLHGISTREAAENLCNRDVSILAQDAAPLAPDEYYLHDLYGMRVETDTGELIGTVREVLETGASNVIIVTREGQPDALIPMIGEFVTELDQASQRIVIRVVEGLL